MPAAQPIISNNQFQAMQTGGAVSQIDWDGDKAHPTTSADSRANLCIQGKTAPVLDCVATQTFHCCPGLLAIECDSVVTSHQCPPWQSKDVINSAGPEE